jgi:hypothetical protein
MQKFGLALCLCLGYVIEVECMGMGKQHDELGGTTWTLEDSNLGLSYNLICTQRMRSCRFGIRRYKYVALSALCSPLDSGDSRTERGRRFSLRGLCWLRC